jgi:UDP-N-acetylglucosamine 2-epimerase (non-hydrolysing)
MKIFHLVGTRPNFMKIAPVIAALEERAGVQQRLVHTGQHYDHALSDAFFDDLEMPHPDHFLAVGSGTHGEQTARVILALEPLLAKERPDVLLVPGDVNSTLAGALAAVKLQIPVAHLEAGLRSRDRSMPEEHNRVATDHLSDLLLTPSPDADENLLAEGVSPERIARVGNVMIDSVRRHEETARTLNVAGTEFDAKDYLLVTLHRPALVDVPARLIEVMEVLEEIARERAVIFPVHPRTSARLERAGFRAERVRLVGPQGYLRFLSLELAAAAVLTDSGGIQEETTVLGIPCFTLRANTERPITVSEGTNRVLGVGADALAALCDALAAGLPSRNPGVPEGWDGRASERVADALVARYGGLDEPTDAARRSPAAL